MIDPCPQWGRKDTQKGMRKAFPSFSPFTPQDGAVPSLETQGVTTVASLGAQMAGPCLL